MREKYFSRDHFSYLIGILSHPLDSFYEIRYRDKGSVPIALICVFLLSVNFTLNRIFTGFILNDVNPRSIDGIQELGIFIIILGLFSIGNWSVTVLMEGEGRMRDIVTVSGYSLLPLVLLLGPATILSRFVAIEEAAFYQFLIGIAIVWTILLMLIGVMTVHNYTLFKTLITLVLTFITMLIIMFISLLIFDLINQIIGFFRSIYTEIIFRF
ncbi:MAG: YIP1 family protein [Oscillospiraceae bacterium]|jgi:hypothetical protein|nr:YIP1 family protein [Oscillospiraceae bacterium]